MVGQVLRGQVVVDSTAIVGFFLSPRGFSAFLISATIFLTVRLLENAGLSVLVAGQATGARLSAWTAFKHTLARSVSLLRATLFILVSGLALLTPLALMAGFLARRLLSQHDINYYLNAKPPEFVQAAILLAAMALITVGFAMWFAIRWRWVIQVLMFESIHGIDAFRRSAALAQPVWFSIAWRWAALGGVNLILGSAAAWIGRLILPMALGLMGKGALSLGFVLGGLWVLQGVIGSFSTLVGSVLEAQIFTRFYLRLSGRPINLAHPDLAPMGAAKQMNWWIKISSWILLSLIGGILGSIWGTSALFSERPLLVIAHRASLHDAPENTVPAILQAIQDGADVAEIDVQLSRDGVVVLAHDSDFSRTAGVAKRISELNWNEIRRLDVGGSFPEKFHGTRPARLEEILQVARGRIRLNIELKHYAPVDGRLEESVVRLVEKMAVLKEIEIQSLEYEALEMVRRLNSGISLGYLLSVNARQPEKLQVDFLSVQMSRVDARFLRRAHRKGQKVYVWTVDEKPQMEKALALGVDGLITNRSDLASAFVKEWESLSAQEKALRRLKFWLER
ncbi:MAG: hypothetical protein KCHDKBKB_01337 [Elusimicrobia bacterium]|nr:hypothetical protein [Elusimicrobiota bacterium]